MPPCPFHLSALLPASKPLLYFSWPACLAVPVHLRLHPRLRPVNNNNFITFNLHPFLFRASPSSLDVLHPSFHHLGASEREFRVLCDDVEIAFVVVATASSSPSQLDFLLLCIRPTPARRPSLASLPPLSPRLACLPRASCSSRPRRRVLESGVACSPSRDFLRLSLKETPGCLWQPSALSARGR